MKVTRPNVIELRDVGSAYALEATSTIQTLNRNVNTKTMHFDSGEPAWFPHYLSFLSLNFSLNFTKIFYFPSIFSSLDNFSSLFALISRLFYFMATLSTF